MKKLMIILCYIIFSLFLLSIVVAIVCMSIKKRIIFLYTFARFVTSQCFLRFYYLLFLLYIVIKIFIYFNHSFFAFIYFVFYIIYILLFSRSIFCPFPDYLECLRLLSHKNKLSYLESHERYNILVYVNQFKLNCLGRNHFISIT